ncbi:hypothetical protein AB4Z46_34660 [Variovorax sp. M-6]|uniref:hypothetical protein n=1 Tax=Variovorax sp. M-6 TaxID=3233041 RepID=UPI003F94C060
MFKVFITFKTVAAMFLISLAAACATSNPEHLDTAIAAGFKIVTPINADQKAIFAKLPKNTITPVNYRGATYYVLPDSSNGMAYVGSSAQYSVYREMRYQKQMSNEDLKEAQIDELNNMNWGAWGGAGAAFTAGFP